MAAKQVICDSDVIIDYSDSLKPRHAQTRQIVDHSIELDNVVISGITKMELMQGALNKTDLARINKGISRFNTALIDPLINTEAVNLLQKYTLSHGLSLPDSLIAALLL